jgi:hypothetical protein
VDQQAFWIISFFNKKNFRNFFLLVDVNYFGKVWLN